ncbi:MAG: alpha/beta fold hydrolase [Parvularculales bacterium]
MTSKVNGIAGDIIACISPMRKTMRFTLFFSIIVSGALSACSASETASTEQYIPSPSPVVWQGDAGDDFATYLNWAGDRVRAYINPLSSETRDLEIRLSLPYERGPNAECDLKGSKKGVVLVHGLGDTPTHMDSLAEFYAEHCFVVRNVLLPGHGTRPADLMEVNYEDWVQTVEFTLLDLKQHVDHVYLTGFSIGGAVVLHLAAAHPDISGVVAIAPALKVGFSVFTTPTVWLRNWVDWADSDPRTSFAKYDSMPMNGIAQSVLLAEAASRKICQDGLRIPVLMVLSDDDNVINSSHASRIFERCVVSDASRLVIYQRQKDELIKRDRRIEINGQVPSANMRNYSHRSMHIAPTHPVFGSRTVNGCALPSDSSDLCVRNDRGHDNEAGFFFDRRTYNPKWQQFESLLESFIEEAAL